MADACPFARTDQLVDVLDDNTAAPTPTLPGYPQIDLGNVDYTISFLESDLCSPDLDRILPRISWMRRRQDGAGIYMLHLQRVKQRRIVISEEPTTHLMWHYDTIFIKPIPQYLLSHTIWTTLLTPKQKTIEQQQRIRKAALGLLRSYAYLIRYESDFRIAQDLHLLPAHVSWSKLCPFLANFRDIRDADVSERYTFGEIRVTRLNFYAKILPCLRNFHRIGPQYATFIGHYYPRILFELGAVSIVLNAMQVWLTLKQVDPEKVGRFWYGTCHWISVIAGFAMLWGFVSISMLLLKVVREFILAVGVWCSPLITRRRV